MSHDWVHDPDWADGDGPQWTCSVCGGTSNLNARWTWSDGDWQLVKPDADAPMYQMPAGWWTDSFEDWMRAVKDQSYAGARGLPCGDVAILAAGEVHDS